MTSLLRCYAINHTALKDFGSKPEEGMYVGIKQAQRASHVALLLCNSSAPRFPLRLAGRTLDPGGAIAWQ